VAGLDRPAERAAARHKLGLDPTAPVLLVTGGSQGAARLNAVVTSAAGLLARDGVQVLHLAGQAGGPGVRAALEQAGAPPSGYHVLDYLDDMASAYAAADLALCRAGAMTCAELTAVGLPAVYVPLPIGNGEQALNAAPVVAAGGGLVVADAELSAAWLEQHLLPLAVDPARLAAMSAAAARLGHRDADQALVALVHRAAQRRPVAADPAAAAHG